VQLLRADPDSSEDEHFRIMLVQTEIERVKFVIRSYIRTRLHKASDIWYTELDNIYDRVLESRLKSMQSTLA
jgi:hypothetical protein